MPAVAACRPPTPGGPSPERTAIYPNGAPGWRRGRVAARGSSCLRCGALRVAEVTTLDVNIEDGKIKSCRARVTVSFKYEGQQLGRSPECLVPQDAHDLVPTGDWLVHQIQQQLGGMSDPTDAGLACPAGINLTRQLRQPDASAARRRVRATSSIDGSGSQLRWKFSQPTKASAARAVEACRVQTPEDGCLGRDLANDRASPAYFKAGAEPGSV